MSKSKKESDKALWADYLERASRTKTKTVGGSRAGAGRHPCLKIGRARVHPGDTVEVQDATGRALFVGRLETGANRASFSIRLVDGDSLVVPFPAALLRMMFLEK